MRYFLEVAYKGTKYSGFQVQQNANTVQAEVERALATILKTTVELTGSSRTDAGVHALQNFFHFDFDEEIKGRVIYNLNALLPQDVVAKSITKVAEDVHARFLALGREYKYFITSVKDPFSTETAWLYPYKVDLELLNKAATLLFNYTDYTSFSKRNTQAYTNECSIIKTEWYLENGKIVYNVKANRFLRGMVRGLVGTMLLAGREKISINEFEEIIKAKDCSKANFATPAHGLFLVSVEYPSDVI